MNTLVYPYQSLECLPETWTDDAANRLARTSALLLYSEKVTLGRLGLPDELSLPSNEEVKNEIDAILAKHGTTVMQDYLTNEKLTWDEVVTLLYAESAAEDGRFVKTYMPLIDEGVITSFSLAKISKRVESVAQLKGLYSDLSLNMDGLFNLFLERFTELEEWSAYHAHEEAMLKAILDYDGLGIASMYLREHMRNDDFDLIYQKDLPAKFMLFQLAYLLGIHHQSFLSAVLKLPLSCFSDVHLNYRIKYAQDMQSQDSNNVNVLAMRVFEEAMIQVPAALPRSPESILYLREALSEELNQFRVAAKRIAEDLIDDSLQVPQAKEISRKVREKFKRPLEDLQKRLAHPNRELLRNLASSGSAITGIISFTTALMTGSTPICAAITGVAVPVLSESIKTLTGRNKEVEQKPDVAFLYKVVERENV